MTAVAPRQMDPHSDRNARKAARMSAVQALYQMELTGNDAESVAQEFVDHRFQHEAGPTMAAEPDVAYFRAIVRGVPHSQAEIDRAIALCLSADWRLTRIDSILRAILRAGTYELIGQRDVPVRVVIDEYLDIAHAFFQGEEPAFVNAVLDKLAHRKRAAEFGETPPDDELEF
jgi:N utilization substance protein B